MAATQEKAQERGQGAEQSRNGSNSSQAAPPSAAQSLGEAANSIAGKVEAAAAEKADTAVTGRGFATLLGWVTENVIAVTRIGSDVADLAVRNLRLAGRRDLARLGVQQARTEDKLERLLAEVEKLEAELRRSRGAGSGSPR